MNNWVNWVIFCSLLIVSCSEEPSLLDRCIESNMANMPKASEAERDNTIRRFLHGYELVFPDEESRKLLHENMNAIHGEHADIFIYETVGDLFNDLQAHKEYLKEYDSDASDVGVLFRISFYKYIENLFEHNKKYYGFGEDILDAYYKKTATSICNAQGIY